MDDDTSPCDRLHRRREAVWGRGQEDELSAGHRQAQLSAGHPGDLLVGGCTYVLGPLAETGGTDWVTVMETTAVGDTLEERVEVCALTHSVVSSSLRPCRL